MSNSQHNRVSALLHEAVAEPPRDITVADVAKKMHRRRIRSITGPLGAVVLVVLIAGAVLIVGRGGPYRDSAADRLASTDFPGAVTLLHPSSWYYVANGGAYFGPVTGLGYLTNQPAAGQCSTQSTSRRVDVTCRPPVTRMTSGGVFVNVEGLGRGTSAFMTHLDTKIDGFPASIIDSNAMTPACPVGASRSINAVINLASDESSQAGIEITVCLAGKATEPAARAARQMITTAHLPRQTKH